MANRYRVYRNLRTGSYSIKDVKLDLVVAHCSGILLANCELVINQSGKNRAIATHQRNVHAFIEGEIVKVYGLEQFKGRHIETTGSMYDVSNAVIAETRVTYNPFSELGFVDLKGNEFPKQVDYIECGFDSETGRSTITAIRVMSYDYI